MDIAVQQPNELVDIWVLSYPNDQTIFDIKLNQNDYDEKDPNWFCMTLAKEYTGMPDGDEMAYGYI